MSNSILFKDLNEEVRATVLESVHVADDATLEDAIEKLRDYIYECFSTSSDCGPEDGDYGYYHAGEGFKAEEALELLKQLR